MQAGLPPTSEEIRGALQRILETGRLRRSARARQLLTYLVEETLAGRGESLKAFGIAVDAFGRDASFDAESDTLVRVQAGRLRDLLEGYYAAEGKDDPIGITLPRGGYMPLFARRESAAPAPEPPAASPSPRTPPLPAPEIVETAETRAPRGRGRRRLAWLGLAAAVLLVIAGAFLALHPSRTREAAGPPLPPNAHLGLRAQADSRPPVIRLLIARTSPDPLEGALLLGMRQISARFGDFTTILREVEDDARQPPFPEDYRLRIDSVTVGNSTSVSLSAVHLASGTVVGNERVRLHLQQHIDDVLPLESALIAMLQPLGPIITDYQRRGDYSPVMNCLLALEDYIPDQTDDKHEYARHCAERLIAAGVEDARLYVVLAAMHRDEYTDQRNIRAGPAIERALAAAQRAVQIAPRYARAYETLMSIYALTGSHDLMIAAGRKAIELNPADSNIVGGFAARIVFRGQYAEALNYLQRSEELEPVSPRWRTYAFFLAHYGLERMRDAMERANILGGSKNPLYLAARAIAARHARNFTEMDNLLVEVYRYDRAFRDSPRNMYERRSYESGLVERLSRDLERAE